MRTHRRYGSVLLVFVTVLAVASFWNRNPRISQAKIPGGKAMPQLHVSYDGAFLIPSDGSLWAWGNNPCLFRTPITTPRQVGSSKQWKQAAQGLTLAVALKTDGSLWTWVYSGKRTNVSGDIYLPTQLGAEQDWAVVRAGASHALALKCDGSLWSWGQNNYGQVGDGSREDRKQPVRISVDNDWKDLCASHFASYGLKSNGTIWAWGDYVSSGKGAERWKPTPIDTKSNCVAITAGPFHMAALRTDGTLWVIGANAHVVASDFIASPPAQLMQMGADTDWTRIHSGANGFLARKVDGTWWASGENHAGQLGIRGRWIPRPMPLPISFEPWALDTGGQRTLVLTGDGDLWMFGMPFERSPGLGAKITKAINTGSTILGLGEVLSTQTPHRPKPVKIWTVPPP